MLPEGFSWRPHVHGPALYCGERMVAVLDRLPNGKCRADLRVGFSTRRSWFGPDEGTAVRYVEAWARRWQDRIRAEVRGIGIGGR